jgi:protoheme IX farnesyltransferase
MSADATHAQPVPLPAVVGPGGFRRTVAAYLRLTKVRIIELLLVTTVPAMILARRSVPSAWLIAATLIGGTIAAGGANALNQFLDRDIDELMRRTRHRPLPSHQIQPTRALVFGLALGVVAFVWLAVLVNLLAAGLAIGAMAFYVLVYTMWLKRSSPQNIVIGGAAGAVPVLVGWAAVTGRIGVAAVVLFAIVFMWTPPHFWALAMRYERDYAAAGVPMLPVVAGRRATTGHIVAYTVALVAVTVALYPLDRMGLIYLGSSVVLGALFIGGAVRLHVSPSLGRAMALFRFSIAYLALLFASVAVDALVRIRP